MAEFIIDIPAGAFDRDPTDYPEWEKLAGTNGEMIVEWFDDTTEEYLLSQIQIPADLTSGAVYIEVYGFAKAADGNNIQLKLSHSAKAVAEDWDAAYDTLLSGDTATNAVQDKLDFIEFSDTVANLGWEADDHVRIKISRAALAGAGPVVGDYGITHVRIRIPIA